MTPRRRRAAYLIDSPSPALSARRGPLEPCRRTAVDLSSLLQAVSGLHLDDVLVWGVAALAGVIALVAVANAIGMFFFDTEAG